MRQRITSMSIQESESHLEEQEEPETTFNTQVHLELNDDTVDTIQEAPESSATVSRIKTSFLGRFRRLSEDELQGNNEENSMEPKILSDEELLHKYWKHVVKFYL